MKKKYFLIILFLIFAMFLVGCGGITTPTKILSANIIITEWKQEGPGPAPKATFTITSIEQNYYEYSEEWSTYVNIYYEVENIGTVEIDSYKVWFTVTCIDGSKYYDWDSGYSLGVGKKLSDSELVNVAGKQAISVEITDWELTNYEYSSGWSNYVYVYYEVENTGNVEIDYYKVYLTVTCIDGSKYYDWTNGLSVGVGYEYSDYTMVNVAGKQAISVEITDWELTSWGF
ncbi:hypothetical protein CVT91_05460 [Candidatus Atribacteria bacterium HGW-Atribacteria-1]|nr:MAG: hypothetical protein CVT91_05460 [Candidatus Atribacteria bacterium HGW-Atribacteria-1]